MKELSVEQKARRYDEVIVMAKECITYIPDGEVNKYMFDMFPELKESEGERTRKELINFVKSHLARFPQCEKYIAWLEKQGEQKTTWKPTEEQVEALEHFLETIRRYEYSYFHEETFLWLHSLLEQLKELTFCSPKIFR